MQSPQPQKENSPYICGTGMAGLASQMTEVFSFEANTQEKPISNDQNQKSRNFLL